MVLGMETLNSFFVIPEESYLDSLLVNGPVELLLIPSRPGVDVEAYDRPSVRFASIKPGTNTSVVALWFHSNRHRLAAVAETMRSDPAGDWERLIVPMSREFKALEALV